MITGLLRFLVLGVVFSSAGAALAQQTVPLLGAACPSGASFIGSGLCRSFSGAGYVPSRNGICPSGTLQAGGGYCQTDGRTEMPLSGAGFGVDDVKGDELPPIRVGAMAEPSSSCSVHFLP